MSILLLFVSLYNDSQGTQVHIYLSTFTCMIMYVHGSQTYKHQLVLA
jgi:hypothetical protein